MNLPARPMPPPPANVQPYVDCLGIEAAMALLLSFGGSQIVVSARPGGRGMLEAICGSDGIARMADDHRIGLQPRVPLANRWLAAMLHWQGHSKAEIARRLRASDVTVRKWLSERAS